MGVFLFSKQRNYSNEISKILINLLFLKVSFNVIFKYDSTVVSFEKCALCNNVNGWGLW